MRGAGAEHRLQPRQRPHQAVDHELGLEHLGRLRHPAGPRAVGEDLGLLAQPLGDLGGEPAQGGAERHAQRRRLPPLVEPELLVGPADARDRQRAVAPRRRLAHQQHRAGAQARDEDVPLARGFVHHRPAVDRTVARELPLQRREAGPARRHRQVDRRRATLQRRRVRLEVDLQRLRIVELLGDHQPVRQHGLHLAHAQQPLSERRGVDVEAQHAPVEGRQGGGVVVEQLLLAQRELLEVLRREQHPLVPVDGLRHAAGLGHGVCSTATSSACRWILRF